MEKTVVGSGRSLRGKELFLEIGYSHKSIRIDILMPEGYSSVLTGKIAYEYDELYVDRPRSFGTLYLVWRKKLGEKYVAFLSTFYVYAQKYYSFSSPEEKEALKGMGRLMLCTALRIGLRNESITPNTTVFLEADGGDPESFNQQTGQNFTREDVLGDIKNRFPEELQDLLDYYSTDLEGLISWYKRCLTNMNLVKFYESIGFKVTDKNRCTGVPMMSDVKTVLSNVCPR